MNLKPQPDFPPRWVTSADPRWVSPADYYWLIQGRLLTSGKKLGGEGFIVKRRTTAKRLRAKLRAIRETLLRRRHDPIPELGAWLRPVVQGYLNDHAVTGNMAAMAIFRREVCRAWLRALRRLSQRHRLNWERFHGLIDTWIPPLKILHPHPDVRFIAKHST